MKTKSAYFNINNNGLNQLITRKSSLKHLKYYQNYELSSGNFNGNANISQIEHERNQCEKELYRLRYGIESLLANREQDGSYLGEKKQDSNMRNSFRTTIPQITDFNDRTNTSWIDRCTPCCRRWRRNRRDNHFNSPTRYSNRSPPTPRSSLSSQFQSDSFIPNSPSTNTDGNRHRSKFYLKQTISNPINEMTSNKMNISNLLKSKDINDNLYKSLILKILESKALDCLCTGYSKKDTEEQITKALTEIDQRINEQQSDSISINSTRPLFSSNQLRKNDSDSSKFIIPHIVNETSITPPSSVDDISDTSSIISKSPSDNKEKVKSSLKLNENIKSSKKKSKVTIVGDKRSKSNKSKQPRRQSSKHRKKSRQKPSTSPSPNKSRSSTKLKNKKDSLKSSTQSKTNKKLNSEAKLNHHRKQKRSKPK